MEMDGGSEKEGGRRKFLDLMPNNVCLVSVDQQNGHGCLEEKRLELRLGLPGQGWSNNKDSTRKSKERDESFLSLGYGSSISSANNIFNSSSSSSYSASPNSSQERSAPAPVVGWPPVRSFRKNLTTTSSNPKPAPDSRDVVPNKVLPGEKPAEACRKCQFVKINMEGVPIGRKVDLIVNDSYEKLSSAVDELFRGLLAAQKRINGLMDGTGEYTLVYEDNEGDQLLAGDVPWPLFVSTVKRLRVLKSSEISALTLMNARARKNRRHINDAEFK